MTEMSYIQRLKYLHQLCMASTMQDDAESMQGLKIDLEAIDAEPSAHFLACYLTFKAIQNAGRHPADELKTHFDMIAVYQCYALLIYAFLMNPLVQEGQQPDFLNAQVTLAKTLFDGIAEQTLSEIIDSGFHKFSLIAEAEAEHWQEYRETLDKVTISYLVAGTDEQSPHTVEEILPFFGQLLSQLCEAFGAD